MDSSIDANAVYRIPELDAEADKKLHKRHADLSKKTEKLQTDEANRHKRIAEIQSRAIDSPPTWQEREALEKEKTELLNRRAELRKALAILATDCASEMHVLVENLPPESEVQDDVAERLRSIGYRLERSGGNGPFVSQGPVRGIPMNGVVLGHPSVVANRERRKLLRSLEENWKRYAGIAEQAATAAGEDVEQERHRIMQVV